MFCLCHYVCRCQCVFVFSHCVVNTGVTNVWDARYLADSVLNSFMCRPILLLLRHIPDNSLSKIEFCLYTLHFSTMTINWFYFCLFPKKLGDGHRFYHLLLFQDPNRVFMHASISSQRKQHPFFTNINKLQQHYMAKLETQNTIFGF